MKYLVQKFGGSSLVTEKQREQVISRIIDAKRDGFAPVVVVSAIGRRGEPYATDTLLDFVYKVNREVRPRELDLLMSCGEIISGVVLASAIQKHDFETILLNGMQAGIITDNNYNDARILRVKAEKIIKHAKDGRIVIVAGFQGVTEEGEVTTLGRGGSDTTAAALGVALNAEYVEIYTDVEGIMTADPRVVEEARILETVTYEEICQLAREGAKVIHPRAVEIVREKKIPLIVKSITNKGRGTLVAAYSDIYKSRVEISRDRTITGITHVKDVAQLLISTGRYPEASDKQLRIFKALALAGISIDFINVKEEELVFTVKEEVLDKAVKILKNAGFDVHANAGCAKIAAVGAGMTGVPGVMADIAEALAQGGIRILQSADSYTSIWVLVKREEMEKAMRLLHRKFKLGGQQE